MREPGSFGGGHPHLSAGAPLHSLSSVAQAQRCRRRAGQDSRRARWRAARASGRV